MPIYEYHCESCGHRFENLQKISDASIPNCLQCHSADTKRIVSATSFHLKGTGWYATDFRNLGKNPATLHKEEGSGEAGKEQKVGSEQKDTKIADGSEQTTTTTDSAKSEKTTSPPPTAKVEPKTTDSK